MKVSKFEIVDHGVEHEQYFQGCGVALTEYSDVFTGIGNSPYEALNDAMDQLGSAGWAWSNDLADALDNADDIDHSDHVPDETQHTDCGDTGCFAEGMHYYVSLRVKGAL